jgi:hypothetical protein
LLARPVVAAFHRRLHATGYPYDTLPKIHAKELAQDNEGSRVRE